MMKITHFIGMPKYREEASVSSCYYMAQSKITTIILVIFNLKNLTRGGLIL